MGNWMTVEIDGTCDPDGVRELRKWTAANYDDDRWGCLCGANGLCGVGDWAATRIRANGNLAERDCSVDDVAENLRALMNSAPSLDVVVHCGGDYESTKCVASVRASHGLVEIGEPEVQELAAISEDAMMGRLMKALHK